MDAISPSARPEPGAGRSPHRPVFRVRSLPDLLSLVPVVLGFEPCESLVVVALAGSRPGFHLRTDLPSAGDGPDVAVVELAEQVAAAVVAHRCTRVAVLAFTAHDAASATLREVAAAVSRDGVEVADVIRTDGSRFWSLECDDPRCCPPEGVAYDPRSSRLRAEAALAGMAVAPDRSSLAERLAACSGARATRMRAATGAAEREVVAALGLRGRRALARPPRTAVSAAAILGAARVEGLLDRLLDSHLAALADPRAPDPVTDADAAALSVWCSIVCFRDLAWSRIDRASARAHLAVWSSVARRVVAPYEPAVLSLAGFAAWVGGDGASAWCAVDRALAADPGYSMARLLADALTGCVPPDVWVPPPREVVLASAGARRPAE